MLSVSLAKLIQPFSTLLFFNKPSAHFRFATEGKAESLRNTRKLSFSHHMTEDLGPENKWKRETAFLCTADFNNNLPPNPIRWKLMDFPTHRTCLALPGAEALHDELSQRNTLSADLGESVDPVLLKKLQVCSGRASLLPQDAALLNKHTNTHRTAARNDFNVSSARRPDLSKALWLMNTQYISSMTLPEHLGRSEKDWAKRKHSNVLDITRRNSHVSQIEAVHESFKAAQNIPAHEKNADIHPAEVIAVLPDIDRQHGSYIHFTFDESPASDIDGKDIHRNDCHLGQVENSLVKPYSIDGASSSPDKFIAYMTPSLPIVYFPKIQEGSHKYEWRSEYQYRMANEYGMKPDAVCLLFDPGMRCMRYVKLNSRMLLSRRSKHAKGRAVRRMQRPSSITVKRIPSDLPDSPRVQKINRL